MSVTFSAPGLDPGIDADGHWEPHPLEVNMSNRNAASVAASLGIELDPDWCGQMAPADFLGRVLMALAIAPADEGMPSHELPRSPGQARWIEGARPQGYLQERLGQLHALATWALGHDSPIIWG